MTAHFTNLPGHLLGHAAALTFFRPRPTTTWTYENLRAGIEREEFNLQQVSREAELLAVVMAPQGDSVAALLAVERLGHHAILLQPNIPSSEMTALLEEESVSLIHLPRGGLCEHATSHGLPFEPGRNGAGDEGWLRVADGGRLAEPFRSVDAFICQLTSGSMGPSRFAVRTRRGVRQEIDAVSERLGMRQTDRVLVASSIAHSYGLIGGVLAGLASGAHVILAAAPPEALTLMTEIKPTVIFGLASTYRAMLDSPLTSQDLSQTRVALSAGAPLPGGLFDSFHNRFGIAIRQDYGTTETGTICIDFPGEVAPDTVGKLLSHLEVRLGEPEIEQMSNIHALKEVQVRGESVAPGYLAGDLQSCLDEDGWYHTGDSGSFDMQGRLRLGPRLRSPICVDRTLISPETVERAISALPGVVEVVALGFRNGAGKPGIKAVVVAPGLGVDDLRHWTREHLLPEEQPALFELRDQLPRSPAGKILHKYLV